MKCIDCLSWLPDFFFSGRAPEQGTCKNVLSDNCNKTRSACYSCTGHCKRETPNPAVNAMDSQYRDMYISWMRRRGDGVTFETNEVQENKTKRVKKAQTPAFGTRADYHAYVKAQKKEALSRGWVTSKKLEKVIGCHTYILRKLIVRAGILHATIKSIKAKYYTKTDVEKILAEHKKYLSENPRSAIAKSAYSRRKKRNEKTTTSE